MKLKIETIDNKSKDIKQIKKILQSSFPKEERMPFFMMLLLSKTPHMEFLSFYDHNTLCGFVYLAKDSNITFIIFLAVEETLRSKGYGSTILQEIQQRYPNHKIILYIDRCDIICPDQEKRYQRKQFYLKNGFVETGYLTKSTKEYQEILIKNGSFDQNEFASILKKSSNGMLKLNIIEKEKS